MDKVRCIWPRAAPLTSIALTAKVLSSSCADMGDVPSPSRRGIRCGRRRVDFVVYKNGELVALIETESDLNYLRIDGITKRNGHYDVASIAKSNDGTYFNSYNSIERMASAAFYWNVRCNTGSYPSPNDAVKMLEALMSDDSRDHNPAQIPLFLVSGFCRRQDPAILSRRLGSLGAKLICVHAFIFGSGDRGSRFRWAKEGS